MVRLAASERRTRSVLRRRLTRLTVGAAASTPLAVASPPAGPGRAGRGAGRRLRGAATRRGLRSGAAATRRATARRGLRGGDGDRPLHGAVVVADELVGARLVEDVGELRAGGVLPVGALEG